MLNDLRPIYGDSFLRYVLALAGDLDLSTAILTTQQNEVCALLRQLAATAPQDPQQVGRHFSTLSSLGRWQDASGSSVANALRVHSGGDFPAIPTTSDDLVRSLLTLARDAWPSLLIPPPQIGPTTFWTSVPVGIFNNPEAITAGRLFLADDALRSLFPDAPSGQALNDLDEASLIAVSAFWHGSSGRGGTQQLIGLLGMLISNARLGALMETGDDTWEGLIQILPRLVESLRHLAQGETVDVPCLIAFRGLSLEANTVIELSHGRLVSPRPHDRDFLLQESEDATVVFVTTYPLRLYDIQPWSTKEDVRTPTIHSIDVIADQQRAERQVDLTRLAILLASPDGERWAMAESATLILDPTAPGGVSRWSGQKRGTGQGQLSESASAPIGEWWAVLQDSHPVQLDIAMKRVLDAAASRLDPIDGFVDAVIAWENCFGTSTETTFRVTGAIATMLVATAGKERLERQKKLKSLYEKRSRIVHGSLQPQGGDPTSLRNEALDVALACLRSLYRERPDLLPLKSEERSLQLLLGTPAAERDEPRS